MMGMMALVLLLIVLLSMHVTISWPHFCVYMVVPELAEVLTMLEKIFMSMQLMLQRCEPLAVTWQPLLFLHHSWSGVSVHYPNH
jgi:hypothetical protein